jgi:hypothetical protein
VNVRLVELSIADDPDAWREAGFAVGEHGLCWVGSVLLNLVGREAGRGIVGWALETRCEPGRRVVGDLDGVPTEHLCEGEAPKPRVAAHDNGVTSIDHVVLMTPHLERTLTALGETGLEPRRHRDGELGGAAVRQVFYRLGEVILEVVGSPDGAGEGPASLWGITFNVADIDTTAALLGEGVGRVKDAVQPGRRITTLRHKAFDMSVPTAFITPHVAAR